jgi:hypothetical protein
MTRECQFCQCVPAIRHGNWTNEKNKNLGVLDRAFDLLIIACAGWQIVASKKDVVAAASERQGERLGCRVMLRCVRQENLHQAVRAPSAD